MKKLLLFGFILLSVNLFGQYKGTGIHYFRGIPSGPDTATVEIALDVLTGRVYTVNRDSNLYKLETFITQGDAAPSGDPGANPKTFLDKQTGILYRWDCSAWDAYETNENGIISALPDGTVNINSTMAMIY